MPEQNGRHAEYAPQGDKGGTSRPMEHGAKTKAETTPPDRAKKGWENMKSGH